MAINILHRRERFIVTTIEIIDELGIQKLSTREIAKRQGVSEATLFRHYKNKNDLLIAVLDNFSEFDKDIFHTVQISVKEPLKAIKQFISLHAEYYENYPAITSILQLFDVLRYEPELEDKVIGILESRNNFLKHLIEEAQRANIMNSNINSEMLAVMIWGFFRENCLNWRLEDRRFSLKERILSTLELVLQGFQ